MAINHIHSSLNNFNVFNFALKLGVTVIYDITCAILTHSIANIL